MQPSNGTIALEVLAEQLSLYIQENTKRSERIDLIALSMGGLVCRYYLQHLDGLAKTDKLITISTPHMGTITAYLYPGVGVKQMRPKSIFLQNLNANVTKLRQLDFVSFHTPFDLIVIPSNSSVIPIARNYKIMSLLHPLMVYDNLLIKKMVLVLADETQIKKA